MTLLLFAGERYYPDGGAEDFVGSFPSWDALVATAQTTCQPLHRPGFVVKSTGQEYWGPTAKYPVDWMNVLDLDTGEVWSAGSDLFDEGELYAALAARDLVWEKVEK